MRDTRYIVEITIFLDLNKISDYLAPEFVFNTGATHAVDLWALGCVIHEMIMLTTPFRPKKRHDMTTLFINIAAVKVLISHFIIFLF